MIDVFPLKLAKGWMYVRTVDVSAVADLETPRFDRCTVYVDGHQSFYEVMESSEVVKDRWADYLGDDLDDDSDESSGE